MLRYGTIGFDRGNTRKFCLVVTAMGQGCHRRIVPHPLRLWDRGMLNYMFCWISNVVDDE